MRLTNHIIAARLPEPHEMYAGSLPGVVMVERNLSTAAGSGDWPLNGMLKKRMPAALADAAVSSISAPGSLGTRTLMMEAKPIFLMSGTAVAFVAPAHATVVSSFAKLVTPGTFSLVTCCAAAGADPRNAARMTSDRCLDIQPPGRTSSYEVGRSRQRAPVAPLCQETPGEAVGRPKREDAEDHTDRNQPVAGDVVLSGRRGHFHREVAWQTVGIVRPETDVRGKDRLHD